MTKGKEKSPEDLYASKLDMCLTDGIVKTGGGVVIGALTSVLFLGRRRWPVIAGMGVGIGLAYANSWGLIKQFKNTSKKYLMLTCQDHYYEVEKCFRK